MEPAVRAQSVFLFTNPAVGEAFGYKYDGWHVDGTFHYTGDGQTGDQSLRTGGNKSLIDAGDLHARFGSLEVKGQALHI